MTIRGIRKEKGLTQADVANLVGVDRSSIAKYESGERSPSLSVLRRLSETLGCTVDDLIRVEDDEPASKEV